MSRRERTPPSTGATERRSGRPAAAGREFVHRDASEGSPNFLARAGGTPSRNYGPAIKTVAGVRTARIQLDHRRRHWRISVDNRVEVAADHEVDADEPVACGIPGLDRPGQEVRADVLRVDRPAQLVVVRPLRVRHRLQLPRRPLTA